MAQDPWTARIPKSKHSPLYILAEEFDELFRGNETVPPGPFRRQLLNRGVREPVVLTGPRMGGWFNWLLNKCQLRCLLQQPSDARDSFLGTAEWRAMRGWGDRYVLNDQIRLFLPPDWPEFYVSTELPSTDYAGPKLLPLVIRRLLEDPPGARSFGLGAGRRSLFRLVEAREVLARQREQ
jgi:hypothetical protein